MLELNRELHQRMPKYGTYGPKWAQGLARVAVQIGAKTIFDYGCGKGNLVQALSELLPGHIVTGWDPAFDGEEMLLLSELVVCTHVLEHVEPDLLKNVLEQIRDLSQKAVFFALKAGPSDKKLADGRDSNLIIAPINWWYERITRDYGPEWRWRVLNRRAFIVQGYIRPARLNDKELTLIGINKETT
jgi:hypothetical protein